MSELDEDGCDRVESEQPLRESLKHEHKHVVRLLKPAANPQTGKIVDTRIPGTPVSRMS